MEAVEGFLSVVYALLHWRVIACFAASATVAILLAIAGWPSIPQLLVIAFAGIFPGAVWQARAESKTDPINQPTTTNTSAQFIAAALVGSAWGAISSGSPKVISLGAVTLVAASCIWHFYAVRVRHWLSAQRATHLAATVLATYLAAALAANAA
jgi:hypothetical protein